MLAILLAGVLVTVFFVSIPASVYLFKLSKPWRDSIDNGKLILWVSYLLAPLVWAAIIYIPVDSGTPGDNYMYAIGIISTKVALCAITPSLISLLIYKYHVATS